MTRVVPFARRPAPAPTTRRTDDTEYKWLELQLAHFFPRLTPDVQRAYVELMRFQLGEEADATELRRIYDRSVFTLIDDVNSLVLELHERFPDDDAETGGAS